MNIKKTLTLGATAVALLSLTSCAKQQNLNRIEGKWIAVGGSIFQEGSEITMDFDEDGDFELVQEVDLYGSIYTFNGEGEWEWDGDLDTDLELDVTIVGLGITQRQQFDMEIDKLTDDEFEFEDQQGQTWEMERD